MESKIFSGANIIYEDNFLIQYKSLFSYYFYEQNFFQFKCLVNSKKLETIEHYAISTKTSDALLFKLPINVSPSTEVLDFFNCREYSKDKFINYLLSPKRFVKKNNSSDYIIKKVDSKNIEDYLKIKWEQDIELGDIFATENRSFFKKVILNENFNSYIAVLKENNQIVGFIDTTHHEQNVEIYDLFVLHNYRNNYVASTLIETIVNNNSSLISVVADDNDTPKEMYQKLGFKKEFDWIQFQKITEP